LALARPALRVVLSEPPAFDGRDHPSFEDRTTALSSGSRRAFEARGVWPLMEHDATSIRRIHVSDQGRFGFARLDARELGLEALGYVATNRTMGAALWQRDRKSTRLNSSHVKISYAVFCLKKKKKTR